MDESDAEHRFEETVDGVTLRKDFETDAYDVPAVVYEFESDRDEAVTVTVVETIPESLSPEDLGFIGHNRERTWQIKGPKLVFENPIDPHETFETACAARGTVADTITDLLGPPDVFEVTGPDETPRAVVEPADQAGTEPADYSGGDPADQPSAEAAVSDEAAEQERVVEQFVAELQAGDVSPSTVEFLRKELGTADGPPKSVEARLKQLQTDLSDVRAYTNALEEFLDENGSGEEVIDRLERRLTTIESTLDDVDEQVEAHDEDLDGVRAQLEDLDDQIAGLGRELGDVSDQLATVDARLDEVEARLPDYDIDDRIEELDTELSDVSRFTDSLRSAFEQ